MSSESDGNLTGRVLYLEPPGTRSPYLRAGTTTLHATLDPAHRHFRLVRRLLCPPRFRVRWSGRPPTASMCHDEVVRTHQREPPMARIARIGIDTSKSVFQVHG